MGKRGKEGRREGEGTNCYQYVIGIIILLLFIMFTFFLFKAENEGAKTKVNESLDKERIENPKFSFFDPPDYNYSVEMLEKNMEWDHMPLTYFINSTCEGWRVSKIKGALDILTDKTSGAVRFNEIENEVQADIYFGCIIRQAGYCAYYPGFGSPQISQRGYYNVISRAEVIFDGESGRSCPYSTLELHETLHAFGFAHEDDIASIMNEYFSCQRQLKQRHIDALIEIYSKYK